MLEKLFKLKQNHTTVRKEVTAGIITFMTMAYILAVNPGILSAAGMDPTAVLLATALASFIANAVMALTANLPFALSAGMGLNAYLAFTVCGNMGYSWQVALLAVFVEGLIFIVLSLSGAREAIFYSIPRSMQLGVSVGIGLFIALIGLQNAGLVVGNPATMLSLTKFNENFSSKGIGAVLCIVGVLITAFLYIKKVQGAMLIGILATWLLGILCQVTGIYVPNPELGAYSLIPSMHGVEFGKLKETFGQCFTADLSQVRPGDFLIVIFSFLFVDIFDTLGTLIGVTTKAHMLDENGKMKGMKPALLADAVGTSVGAVLGTSTVTTFVESAAGIGAGGRTGLTTMVTGILFLLSMFLAPIFTTIPPFATAPALIVVGFLIFGGVRELNLEEGDMTETLPAYLTILGMPMFYSISDGIAIGVISYVALHLVTGKAKKVAPLMYVLAVLFILNYIFL